MNHQLEYYSSEFLSLITAISSALTRFLKLQKSVNTEATFYPQTNNAIHVDVTGVSWPFIHRLPITLHEQHDDEFWKFPLSRALSPASPIRLILFWSHSSRAVRSVLLLYLYTTTSVMISHHLYSLSHFTLPPENKIILCGSCINRKFWYFESLIRWWYDNDTQSWWWGQGAKWAGHVRSSPVLTIFSMWAYLNFNWTRFRNEIKIFLHGCCGLVNNEESKNSIGRERQQKSAKYPKKELFFSFHSMWCNGGFFFGYIKISLSSAECSREPKLPK